MKFFILGSDPPPTMKIFSMYFFSETRPLLGHFKVTISCNLDVAILNVCLILCPGEIKVEAGTPDSLERRNGLLHLILNDV